MNKVKNYTAIVIACLAMIGIAPAAKAQDGKDAVKSALKESTPEQRAQMQTGMMKAKLKLDSTQVTKVQAINLKSAQKLEPLLKGDERRFKMLREMMAIQKEKDADLKKVLTDDQYKQYEKMKDEMKEKLKDAKQNKS
jgi:hypothetical protein